MKLIFGLGNPGRAYSKTRHNLGFMALDRLAEKYNFSFSKRLFKAVLAEGFIKGFTDEKGTALSKERVVLVKPLTYMNLSGEAVLSFYKWYKADLNDILVICDDFSLPSGTLRFRPLGGDGGHNGLKSIINLLGTKNFCRLRIGMGQPENEKDHANYVLSKFSEDEMRYFDVILDKVLDGIICYLEEGIEKAMNLYNRDFIP